MNQNQSSVSIVIAVYNGARFIRQAIESIFAQTLKNVEIIVVDDGSIDATAEVLKEFGAFIKVIHQNNAGVSAARNRGINEAANEFIAFLDADDYFLLDTKLQEQIDVMRSDEKCGIVHTGWQTVNERGEKIADLIYWKNLSVITFDDWLKHTAPLPSAMMFRRSALLKINGFDEQITQSEDIDIVLRLTLAGYTTRWLEKVTTAYRLHQNNATKNIRLQTEGLEMCWRKFFSLPDLPLDVRVMETRIRLASLLRGAFRSYLAEDYQQMKKFLIMSQPFLRNQGAGALMEWLEYFRLLYKENSGGELKIFAFLETPEWQELVQTLVNEKRT